MLLTESVSKLGISDNNIFAIAAIVAHIKTVKKAYK